MEDDARPRKMEVDYSSSVEAIIPECVAIAQSGKLSEAMDKLLAMEKQTRLAADVFSTEKLLLCIVGILYDSKNLDLLNENVISLTKKRSQLRPAVTKLVQQCCKYVDEITDMPTKLKLIDTLRTVSEGKIYVENERARLTKILADVKEGENKIDEATKLMVDLQVETYNTMDRREKVDFILEQMRLCVANGDYIRTQIISKKVSQRYFEDEATHDLKLRFCNLMIQLDKHEGSFLDICRHYHAIYETPRVKNNPEDKYMALKSVVLYCCLAEHNNEQSDLMNRVNQDKELLQENMKTYKDIMKLFLTPEIISWAQLEANYGAELKSLSTSEPAPDVFSGKGGEKAWSSLSGRVLEHNIRVLSGYYTRVTLPRMSTLLDLPQEEVETCLSRMAFKEMVYARIDDLTGIVSFQAPKDAAKVLDEWAGAVGSLMGLLSHTSHLIDKEVMVHRHAAIRIGGAGAAK